MKMSEKFVEEILEAINHVLLQQRAVVESYRFKPALVSQTVDLILKLRDLTDAEIAQGRDGK